MNQAQQHLEGQSRRVTKRGLRLNILITSLPGVDTGLFCRHMFAEVSTILHCFIRLHYSPSLDSLHAEKCPLWLYSSAVWVEGFVLFGSSGRKLVVSASHVGRSLFSALPVSFLQSRVSFIAPSLGPSHFTRSSVSWVSSKEQA